MAKFLFEKNKKVRSNNLTSTGYGRMDIAGIFDALVE